jgi:hypothetical protein
MARTTAVNVKELLLQDYDAAGAPSLKPFIDTANVIVNRVATCAADKSLSLTAAELELVERWLAAHFYAVSDKPYASKSTAGASASFHGQTKMYLEATLYGQTASRIDRSGCLAALAAEKRAVAGGFWLGKEPSAQTAYWDRD